MRGAIQQLSSILWDMHDDSKRKLSSLFTLQSSAPEVGMSSSQPETARPGTGKRPKRNKGQMIGLWLGPLLFLAIMLFASPEGMSKEALAILASTVWIAVWWMTETVPLAVTSLLPIVLFPLTGAVEAGITSSYADSTIFLFLGGFIIAIALEKWNLHRRIALNIILVVGTSTQRILLGFMVATGFLSMWISNTATAMMMMPIALSVISHVNDSLAPKKLKEENFGKAVMLGVAYAASIGGLGTLIGTPPNMIFAGVARELYGIDISFAGWMLFGVPLSLILLAAVWFYLFKIAFPMQIKDIPGGKTIIKEQKFELGHMSTEEKLVTVVFVLTAFAWITRSFILVNFMPGLDDTIIAIVAAFALFLLPSQNTKDGKLLNWTDAKKIPWDILLLFGGGLAIAKGFKESGLALWIGEQLTVLQGVQLIIIVAAITGLVMFLTEITSNTATATMMFPIMAALALALDVHPYVLMVAAGISASCAFMLPVATPPNAVVFGTGKIKIIDMARAGLWINIFSILVITLLVYFVLPFVWNIDLTMYPESFK
ncbi:DASS family sodium-coupled anion symporter [Bacillus sp. B15-48]|uniref:SLC13 family permease n=1 Tax=Bacillus sp. B15-48 TaxID=1548601 RepID=UPI001EF38A3A|nr:DASS family sodium-coupled anion symporter [Bacillus sp. B15-48]MBM4764425.1 DASS family sodium-coupled anion symporter [Bacillus sp. B15-48]